ncbi:uncharacterized protein LOC143179613 [Calliopsis andreniformis]|uniref:uncharacterized protein LOC143179613 n=1 Tax=Calliopsis andreniformis TaxID=337506 RepID=UPI003FCEB0B0
MPKIREYSEQEALKLDDCFKETLARVRPYILNLTSAESALLCKMWLDKLNTATTQRRLRNEYLSQLCKQLKTGRIEGIFSRPPPNGLLLPFPKSYHMVCISSSLSDISDYAIKPHRSCLKPSAKCIQHQRSKALLKHRMMDNMSTNQCLNALNNLSNELHVQNEHLKNQLLDYPEYHNNSMNNHLSASISQLTSDVTTLKAKLTDVQRTKNSFEQYYKEIIQEYHCTVVEQVTALKQQVEEIELKYKTLDNNISDMGEKLEKVIHGKEDKLQTMLLEKYTMLKEEFNNIRNETDQNVQKQNQNLTCKVSALKKSVSKLEKSKEKLGYEYENKMSLIIKNKNLEIKALQLQLQEQKNELCTSLNMKKQNEMDSMVALLEKQYKTRLAEIEAMSESQIQEYQRKICELEDQVLNMKKF